MNPMGMIHDVDPESIGSLDILVPIYGCSFLGNHYMSKRQINHKYL